MRKMTHEFETRYIDSYAARVRKPGAGETALVTDYGSLDHYLDICKKHYEERRAEFFDSTVETENLPLKAKRFASMAKTYMGLARTILRDYGEFETYHQAALEITDRIVKESGIVLRNLDLHYEKMKEILPKGDVRLIRLSKDVEDGMNFFSRAVATQIVMNRREEAFTGGPAGIEMREEMKAGDRMEALEAKVPARHMYLPARPFPPVEIPEDVLVPDYPEPYLRMKHLPVEDLVYDEVHDEFIIRPGYVSEDGLIDDRSVVWNWKKGTVAMKFRGGEPEIWPFWKAKDAGDIPKGWPARYLRRYYLQWLDSIKLGILKRK